MIVGEPMGFHAHFGTIDPKPNNYITEFNTLYYGTRLSGFEENYLEFNVKFSDVSSIQWLVFEFYNKDEDGNQLY